MTIADVNLPPNQWTDLYLEAGIVPGTSLLLNAYLDNVDVWDELSPPPITQRGVPLGKARESNSATITAGSAGAWARPTNVEFPTIVIVQDNP